jgi:hypothetical protein
MTWKPRSAPLRRLPTLVAVAGELRKLEQFQEKCEAVFRPELRKNKRIERFCASVKS